jgi:peptide/nickel transport system permease protein
MLRYIARRLVYMLVLLLLTSVVSFLIIVLPPGDYLTSYIMELEAEGGAISEAEIIALRHIYGLDQPVSVQYFKWLRRLLRGDLGWSFQWRQPVSELIRERIGMTLLVSVGSLILTYVLAIPIGIYSAVRQYSFADYLLTIFGFIGLSTPNFLLALIAIIVLHKSFGISAGGLYSLEFKGQPWSIAKFLDLLQHLPVPLLVIGTAGTAGLIRVMRGMMLDEMSKPYVTTARAKGVKEQRLLLKYPLRLALNPVVSRIGWVLPNIFSGQTIVSIVLSLPTLGPLLYSALLQEDMFLAASVILISTALTLVGMLISDILLAWLDPRIRYV